MNRRRAKPFARTTLIALALAGFMAGLGLSRTNFNLEPGWLPGLLAAAWIVKRRPIMVALCIICLGTGAGLWRGQAYRQQLQVYDRLYGQKVVIRGQASTDAVYDDRAQLMFELGDQTVVEPFSAPITGKITVRGFGEYMVYKDDQVEVRGKLYKTRGSKVGAISFADIRVLARSDSGLDQLRRRFEAGLRSALPEPLASFGLGLLVGQRTTIPEQVNDQLSIVGLTHIVAVSGYNLTIIIRAARRLLNKRSKFQSTVASLATIGLFLLVTGFSASIVRAALVSCLSLWAWYYGRSFRPAVLILLAAGITAGVYPIYLWSDIGWYLSFLAFYGVLILGPLVTGRLYRGQQPKLLAGLVVETISAQLLTTPLIMYIFGRFSIIALLANVLVVPLVALGMLLCLIAGLAGMLLPLVSGWFALPARWLLTYMLDIVAACARLPNASVDKPMDLVQMLVCYGMILGLVAILWSKNRGKSGIMSLEISPEGEARVRTFQMVDHQTPKSRHRR